MNKRFPVLSTVSSLLRVVGWIVAVVGVIYAGYEGIFEPMLPRHSFSGQNLVELITGLVLGLFGLLTVAFSEVVGVLFAIEENTRTTLQ